jgi:hypothetical protein
MAIKSREKLPELSINPRQKRIKHEEASSKIFWYFQNNQAIFRAESFMLSSIPASFTHFSPQTREIDHY